jgi:site-specific recombinase XerD
MGTLLHAFQLCAATEGKSHSATAIVTNSVRYFHDFLVAAGGDTTVTTISQYHIRAFILYLQQRRCFAHHRFNHAQDRGLSGHTINSYLRSLRIFFHWLVAEEIIPDDPFARVKIPPSPRKIMPTFSDAQIQDLLGVIDARTDAGYRDHTIILTLLDTGLRVSELCHLKLEDVWLEEGLVKVLGKGNKERLIPIGKQVQRCLWRYLSRYRPEPLAVSGNVLFLTKDGRPLNKDRVEKIMTGYGRRAGLTGVRCSPHTLRHSAAVRFLRNGGDVFSLQRLLGHASLEMTRRYCELADSDVKRAHLTASPVDNLYLPSGGHHTRPRGPGKEKSNWHKGSRFP